MAVEVSQDISEFPEANDLEQNRLAAKEDALLVLNNLVNALARHRKIMKAEARSIIREALVEL
jgi:hypothetical protein